MLEIGSRETRKYIVERLMADSTKRQIVDVLVSAHGWRRKAAWDEVRLVEEKLSAARAVQTYGIDQQGENAAAMLGIGALDLILNSVLDSR